MKKRVYGIQWEKPEENNYKHRDVSTSAPEFNHCFAW